MNQISDVSKGIAAIVAAALTWGLAPLYYRLLNDIPPIDILCHRILWSFVFFALVLAARRRLPELGCAVSDRSQVWLILLASIFVSFNWFFFIYAIQVGKLTEASLGYYIYPLVSVVFGYVLFRERFSPLQWAAVGLVTLAVATLTWGLGVVPGISLVLATSFSAYGAVKKKLSTGPLVSVTAEVLLLLPLVLGWLMFFSSTADLTPGALALLVLSGPLTGAPLILFSYAAKKVRLATMGLISYLNPTLQFLVAALIFVEPVTGWHMSALAMIWIALAAYSWVAWRQDRERALTSASTVGTT